MKKSILIITLLILICKVNNAQDIKRIVVAAYPAYIRNSQDIKRIVVAAYPAYIRLFDDKKISSFGGGARLSYNMRNNKTFFSVGFNYYAPKSFNSQFTANELITGAPQIVDTDNKANLIQYSLGIQRYFIGEYQYDFSVYGSLEINTLMGSYTYNLKSPEDNLDYGSFKDGAKERVFGRGVSAGLGCEKKIGFAYLFGEANYNYTLTTETSRYTQEKLIPSYINVMAGIRIPIF